MTNRNVKVLVLIGFFAAALISCGSNSPIVAKIDGKPIYDAEIEKKAEDQLSKINTQIYSIKRNVLNQMVEEKLLEMAAQEKKQTVQQFLGEAVNSKIQPPTEEEMKAFYEARKGKDARPFAEMKPQVSAYLMQTKFGQERKNLITDLRKKYKVEIKMDAPRKNVSTDDDPVKGGKDAKITIIEFSDFQCPFCSRAEDSIDKVMEEYKDQVKVVFRDFPLSFHQDSMGAHMAAGCANDQGKFWEYHKLLFSNQQALKLNNLKDYAKQLGLNVDEFDKCFDSKKYEAEVQKDMQDGSKVGVSGTPAFFINGIMISGAQPFESFKEIIDQELDK